MPAPDRPIAASSEPEIGSLDAAILSWERALWAENRTPRTVQTYLESAGQLQRFLENAGMPTIVAHVRREHIEAFLIDLLSRWKPATVSNRYRALRQLFKWAVQEGEIARSPMVNMRPPTVPDSAPQVLSDDQLRALLRVCAGSSFRARRDTAILRLLIDTGIRREELAGLRTEDVDFTHNVVYVLGKYRRIRACPFGRKTAHSLDRYLRAPQARGGDPAAALARCARTDECRRHLSDHPGTSP